jgi:glycine/D-amino acid oxidase-like deaminating enzyme
LSAPAYAFWPYRLFAGIFQRLIDRYSHRFTIETQTPVISVEHDPEDSVHPYVLDTPRGKVRASVVFYCCNGFTGHLLPRLRGRIFPYRGTMSRQKPGVQYPNLGSQYLWIFYRPSTFDPKLETLDSKMYHQHQNAATGEIFCGADLRYLDKIVVSDDEEVPQLTADNHDHFVSKVFEEPWNDGEAIDRAKPSEHLNLWTGIIGMTADYFPLVGKLSSSITGRAGDGEWIAAGYSGYGMCQCWSCGEAIARMALGEPKPIWLPDLCVISEERLNSEHMASKAALRYFLNKH